MRYIELILIILFFATAHYASGQTIAYEHTATVSPNGQKSRGTKGIRYYTFVNEKRSVYSSDNEGYEQSYPDDPAHTNLGYIFIKDMDGFHYYEHPDLHHKLNPNNPFGKIGHEAAIKMGKIHGAVMRFNNNFTKINIYPYTTPANGSQLPQVTEVWEIYQPSDMPFYE